jgi:energy-coupling factor transport system ATP-binding protein
MLELKHVGYVAEDDTEILSDVSLSINERFVAITGPNGGGKSTLAKLISGIYMPTSGQILLDGHDINASKITRRDVKFQVGLVFQYPEYQLFEETVYKDISFGPQNMQLSASEIDERVREAAGFTGVGEELFDMSPLELSGGQKRRIAIAGVIAMRPSVLILDEPTAGLDPEGSRRILSNITTYRRATGSTVIIVSHNMDDMASLADRIIVLSNGTVAMDGTPEQIFSNPEKIQSLSLDVPQSTRIALELKKLGVDLRQSVFTHEGLLSAILNYRGGVTC